MNSPGKPVWIAVALATVFAASALATAGCGSVSAVPVVGGGPRTIVVRDDANGKTVQARVGDRIELVLSSTYWNVEGSSAPRVLRQDGPAEMLARPSDCPDIPGLGCTPERVDFTALRDGTAVIEASRTSCGEALSCAPNKTRFAVTMLVRASG
jgi:hypothetical protein